MVKYSVQVKRLLLLVTRTQEGLLFPGDYFFEHVSYSRLRGVVLITEKRYINNVSETHDVKRLVIVIFMQGCRHLSLFDSFSSGSP